jgi:hypothetical protein
VKSLPERPVFPIITVVRPFSLCDLTIMTAFRLRLTTAVFLMFVGFCSAQEPARVTWESQSPVIEATEISWQESEAVTQAIGVWGVDAPMRESEAILIHFEDSELHFEDSEPAPACDCGKKRCHGVCRHPGHPKKPKRDKPGDVNRGDCPPLRYRIPDCKRAGNPLAVHRFAKCAVDGKYSSWFVGGGAAFCRGRCRKPTEGTWGLDYGGFFGHANVWLKYTRGRKQGGEGAYATDGEPKIVTRVHHFIERHH